MGFEMGLFDTNLGHDSEIFFVCGWDTVDFFRALSTLGKPNNEDGSEFVIPLDELKFITYVWRKCQQNRDYCLAVKVSQFYGGYKQEFLEGLDGRDKAILRAQFHPNTQDGNKIDICGFLLKSFEEQEYNLLEELAKALAKAKELGLTEIGLYGG